VYLPEGDYFSKGIWFGVFGVVTWIVGNQDTRNLVVLEYGFLGTLVGGCFGGQGGVVGGV
jgi:hypothetical protein